VGEILAGKGIVGLDSPQVDDGALHSHAQLKNKRPRSRSGQHASRPGQGTRKESSSASYHVVARLDAAYCLFPARPRILVQQIMVPDQADGPDVRHDASGPHGDHGFAEGSVRNLAWLQAAPRRWRRAFRRLRVRRDGTGRAGSKVMSCELESADGRLQFPRPHRSSSGAVKRSRAPS
jgi:hypothetical protein